MKIVIVGAGEVGFHIATHLARENKDVVIIDKNPDTLRRVSDNIDVQTVSGSGSSPVILEQAGIKDAEILLAVTNKDETNLVACLIADTLSPGTKKLARIRDADYDMYHNSFCSSSPHIDTIINPEIEVVKTIDRLMSVPGAVDVGEFADGRVKFIGIKMDENTNLEGVTLAELPGKMGGHRPLIGAILRNEKLIIPMGKDQLLAGDIVYFISQEEHVIKTLGFFNKHAEPISRVLIVGGGRIGTRLAKHLEKKSIQTKIIEKNPERCTILAEQLNKPVVLCGDGSDQVLLKEENIQDIDLIVTLTNDEETNILSSLLATRMGAKKSITKISKFSYFPLMMAIGIEQVIDPRLSAINSILQHIRRGKVLSAISIRGEEGEVLEAMALETSDIVGKPLKNISFPKGVLVTAVLRENEVIIPSGETIVIPNDRIIIFALRAAIPKIEKILAVKLEYF
ncbi:Trk system potassium uptake protein [Desulfonema limicola]|uniref:Trk system potassium uptake protein TrkA n=1 Tax=Desulfonema limicola TaxID=45656 RepID=A0A975GIR8_9BACT|nr:Trk system potassium transporter TrkA [Desulfonema limicola]QTA82649.1 Trk system potassium uptake protein [Desulfonema limicola]